MMTGLQEEINSCSTGTSSGKQKKARPASQPQCRSRTTPLRQLNKTRFFWPFSSWRAIVTQPTSLTISANLRTAQSLAATIPPLTESQRNLNCSKICSKQIQISTINSRKKPKSTTSTLLFAITHYKRSKTSPASTEKN